LSKKWQNIIFGPKHQFQGEGENYIAPLIGEGVDGRVKNVDGNQQFTKTVEVTKLSAPKLCRHHSYCAFRPYAFSFFSWGIPLLQPSLVLISDFSAVLTVFET